ncbi:hypothetical protein [Brachybacterium muris]|uniref:hypothetical protein n=1 Tax=Brachybacterium muris TaxID=219301 RepID=UPI00223B2474|nr:hypothetical protein [Brachybacterium muris]MCT1653665.1 hypothetical protein [Brachybacterium muris]
MSNQSGACAKPNRHGDGIKIRTSQGYLHVMWEDVRNLADQFHDLADLHEQEQQ